MTPAEWKRKAVHAGFGLFATLQVIVIMLFSLGTLSVPALGPLPAFAIGLGIAVYHNGIDYGVIPERLAPCTEGVSCKTRQIEWLGFVTIPALALAAFAAIGICLVAYARGARRARG